MRVGEHDGVQLLNIDRQLTVLALGLRAPSLKEAEVERNGAPVRSHEVTGTRHLTCSACEFDFHVSVFALLDPHIGDCMVVGRRYSAAGANLVLWPPWTPPLSRLR